jgi:hypothetical protein
VRFDVRKVALLLLLAASAAKAQTWLGPAALEVRVEDVKGLPVAGAQLQLQYLDLEPLDGPPGVVTDARGRASLGSLAEGAWRIEVGQAGFMTYRAEIAVREGGRPEVVQATQVKVPGALRTLEVRLSRGRSTPPPAPTAPTVKAAPPVSSATAVPPPVAQPTPRAQPSAVPPAPRPEVRPEPAPVPAPAPSTPPAPPPAAIPSPEAPQLRSFKDRTCVECQAGESSLSLERVIPAGGGSGCGGDLPARLKSGEVPADLPPGCHVLRLVLPAGAQYKGYRYAVQDGRESLDCGAGRDCPQGTGRWPVDPVLVRGTGTSVLAPFESGPAEGERRAVFTVYFTYGKKPN